MEYPILVCAYYSEELWKGVQADIIELKHRYNIRKLILKKENYTIVLKNKTKKIEYQFSLK